MKIFENLNSPKLKKNKKNNESETSNRSEQNSNQKSTSKEQTLDNPSCDNSKTVDPERNLLFSKIRRKVQNDELSSKNESRARTYKRERFVKNEYKNRTSLLDDCTEDSYINNSAFRGFVNLGKIIAIFFIIITPIVI